MIATVQPVMQERFEFRWVMEETCLLSQAADLIFWDLPGDQTVVGENIILLLITHP
jgi:hypothetical protein